MVTHQPYEDIQADLWQACQHGLMFAPVESHKWQLNAQHLRARLGQPLTPGQEEEQLHLELNTPPIDHLQQRTYKCIPWQLYMAFMA